MKKLLPLILLISTLFAREYIAIIDFEGIGVTEDEARALTQRLTSEMIVLGVYQVVERSEMKRLLDEQKFQYSGCVDTKCAVEIGKMIGAKYMVVGSISRIDDVYTIDTRLINVESSEAYVSGQYTAQESLSNVLVNGMKSIAYQLCEIEKDVTKIKIFNNSRTISDRQQSIQLGYEDFGITRSAHYQYTRTEISNLPNGEGSNPHYKGLYLAYSRKLQQIKNMEYEISLICKDTYKNFHIFYYAIKINKNIFIDRVHIKFGLGYGFYEILDGYEKNRLLVGTSIFYNILSTDYFDIFFGANASFGIGRRDQLFSRYSPIVHSQRFTIITLLN